MRLRGGRAGAALSSARNGAMIGERRVWGVAVYWGGVQELRSPRSSRASTASRTRFHATPGALYTANSPEGTAAIPPRPAGKVPGMPEAGVGTRRSPPAAFPPPAAPAERGGGGRTAAEPRGPR